MAIRSLLYTTESTATITDTSVVAFLPAAPPNVDVGSCETSIGATTQFGTVAALRTQLFSSTLNPQFNSLGLGTAASGTAGDLLATTATFSGPVTGTTMQLSCATGQTVLRLQNATLGGTKAWAVTLLTRTSHTDVQWYDMENIVPRFGWKQGASFMAWGDFVVGAPALKATGTVLAARLADDSADAPMTSLSLLVSGASGGIGYAAGAGGTITQGVSKTTGVTLNTLSGAITTNNASLAAGTIVSFVLTDTSIAATDVLVLNHISGGTIGSYTLNAQAAAGSATINIRNNTAGALAEAIVIQFVVIKGVNA